MVYVLQKREEKYANIWMTESVQKSSSVLRKIVRVNLVLLKNEL